jgi:hypothetical protein
MCDLFCPQSVRMHILTSLGSSFRERTGVFRGLRFRVKVRVGNLGQNSSSSAAAEPLAKSKLRNPSDTLYKPQTLRPATLNRLPIRFWGVVFRRIRVRVEGLGANRREKALRVPWSPWFGRCFLPAEPYTLSSTP